MEQLLKQDNKGQACFLEDICTVSLSTFRHSIATNVLTLRKVLFSQLVPQHHVRHNPERLVWMSPPERVQHGLQPADGNYPHRKSDLL